MESRALLSGFCSDSALLPLGTRRESPSITIPLHRCRPSLPSLDAVSSGFGRFSGTLRRLHITNGATSEKPRVVAAEEKDSSAGIGRKKLAVFVSGGGSNFKAIHEGCQAGAINGDVVVLVTDKKDCGGAEFARNNGIPVVLFPKTKKEPNGLSPAELLDVLRKYYVDFIILAGYLKLIPVELVRAYPRGILNIHPSLLPAFGGKGYYGMKVHEAVIASKASVSGATVHFVDEDYDRGPILAQRRVPVFGDDTPKGLADRVLQEEHALYVEAVGALCEERIEWSEDGVPTVKGKSK